MDTMLVRLKPYDPRRRHVLRRYTYNGVKFHEERGWYRVAGDDAEYLRGVHQLAHDPHSPPAFDVCTDEEARALDDKEKRETQVRVRATDHIPLSPGRGGNGSAAGTLTTEALPESTAAPRRRRRATNDAAPEVPETSEAS
jgi:hypothetical protein